MKFKLRNILIGTGIAVLGLAAAGAAVGISEKKSDKPDTSDTMTENLDLINLIGDLQSQINSVNTENEQIKSQLNSVNTENQKLNNKANQLSSSLTELQNDNNTLKSNYSSLLEENTSLKNQIDNIFNGDIDLDGSLNAKWDIQTETDVSADNGRFNSISVGGTNFTESDLANDFSAVKVRLNGYMDGQLSNGEIFSAPMNCSFTLYYPYHVEGPDDDAWELTVIQMIRSLNYCKYIDITAYSASQMDTYYIPTSFTLNKDNNMAIDLNLISADGTKTRTFTIANFNNTAVVNTIVMQY